MIRQKIFQMRWLITAEFAATMELYADNGSILYIKTPILHPKQALKKCKRLFGFLKYV
jgi:hypothetical protein